MESNQNMLTEKLGVFEVQSGMENNQIMLMEKLGVFGILKQAIKIPYKCPKFIFLTFLTSLPLIFAMVLHEIILQASMMETKSLLAPPRYYYYRDYYSFYSRDFYFTSYNTEFETIRMLFHSMSPRLFQLGVLYLVPLHLLDLFNTIITISAASTIYTEGPIGILEMLLVPLKKTRITGPLLTSIYVLFLNSFVLFGLIWAVTNSVFASLGDFFRILYVVGSIILTVKWIEWSALWNMSIVFSALDERHGLDALGAPGYFSRGNTKRGFQLMLLFFVWRIVLRLLCLFLGGHDKWLGLVATSLLSCVGNVMKWVVCVVYFYDCKKRVLEKKVDVEESGKAMKTNLGAMECNDA